MKRLTKLFDSFPAVNDKKIQHAVHNVFRRTDVIPIRRILLFHIKRIHRFLRASLIGLRSARFKSSAVNHEQILFDLTHKIRLILLQKESCDIGRKSSGHRHRANISLRIHIIQDSPIHSYDRKPKTDSLG